MEFKDLNATQQAARQGDAQAQFLLGEVYAQGNEVLQNDLMAIHWYRLASSQGHADAMYKLGQLYEQGRGTGADLKQALQL